MPDTVLHFSFKRQINKSGRVLKELPEAQRTDTHVCICDYNGAAYRQVRCEQHPRRQKVISCQVVLGIPFAPGMQVLTKVLIYEKSMRQLNR